MTDKDKSKHHGAEPSTGIPEMKLDERKYQEVPAGVPETTKESQKEMEKTKKELEKLKGFILKKFPFTQSLSILPPQGIKFFIEEEEIPKQTEKHIQLYMVVPEDKLKEIPKITKEIVGEIEKTGQKIWIQVKTPVDVWEICTDSKFELLGAIAMSFPLYDKGFLGALRVAEIHKSLVLRKFEKYIVSYVVAGSLVRGEAIPTSDVDVFIIINDTDVKRMSRLELKERLRGIIYQYIQEATALAGVKNPLSPQIYLLTEFWESVKDAQPVIFTFIRDGIPLYDRHTFMPWKALLRMGKLKPSPEAIDMFMSMGDRTVERVKRSLLDMVIGDIYWSVLTPSQAILMLYGLPPPTHKEAVKVMKEIFVDKEKMLEQKYIDILEEIVIKYYKGYEHEKIKEVSGKEVDKLLKNTEDYIKRMKELRKQIEKRAQEKTIEQIYNDTFELLKNFVGKLSEEKTIEAFEKNYVNKGRFSPQNLRILKDIVIAKKEFKAGKSDSHKIDYARRNAAILINNLIEFNQRCDLVSLEKGKMKIKYKKGGEEKTAELLIADDKAFIFIGGDARKIQGGRIVDANMDEVSQAVEAQKKSKKIEFDSKIFDVLKKEFGDVEVVL